MGHVCSLNCQTPGIHILFSRIEYSVTRFRAAGTRQLSMLLSLSTEYGSSAGVWKALPRASYISKLYETYMVSWPQSNSKNKIKTGSYLLRIEFDKCMHHQPVPKPRLRISQVTLRRSDRQHLRWSKRPVQLPNVATVGILLSEGLGQLEGVFLVLERREFINIFVTLTGGRKSIMRAIYEIVAYFATAIFRSSQDLCASWRKGAIRASGSMDYVLKTWSEVIMRCLHECLDLNPGSAFMERRVDILEGVKHSEIFYFRLETCKRTLRNS